MRILPRGRVGAYGALRGSPFRGAGDHAPLAEVFGLAGVAGTDRHWMAEVEELAAEGLRDLAEPTMPSSKSSSG